MMAVTGGATGAGRRRPQQGGARGGPPATATTGPSAGRGAQPGLNMVPEEIPLWEGGAPGALGAATPTSRR